MKLGAVLLAAGSSSRFGSNKLIFPIGGRPMSQYTMQLAIAASGLHRIVVVTGYPEVIQLVCEYNLELALNDEPHKGQAHSVKIGLNRCLDCDGCMFFVCDQPLLSLSTVNEMIERFRREPDKIICASWQGRRGSPVIFPKELFPQLMKLEGDTGGRAVIQSNFDLLSLVETSDPAELEDMDYNR